MKNFNFKKIKTLREERGMTLQQLAEKIGCRHRNQIYRWEAGVYFPSTLYVCRLAAALKVDPGYFFE